MTGHVPYWPQHRRVGRPQRDLIPIDPHASWSEIAMRFAGSDLLGLCGPLMEQPWIQDALADSGVSAVTSRSRGLAAIRLGHGSAARWIVDRNQWSVHDDEQSGTRAATPDELRSGFDLCDVGVRPTPSSLGQAILRSEYPHSAPPISRPSLRCWRLLKREIVGGRVDTLSNRTFPILYEHDMNSAYVACLDPLPAGPMYQVWDGEEDESLGAVTSYRRWRIWVHEDVPLAPLPCRMTEGVAYRRMGEWTGWYWSEEIAEARALGWECTPMEGYYWTELTHAFRPAMARIWNLRQTAPSPQVAQLVKQSAVAAIGRWAGDMTTTRLGPDAGAGLPYIDALAGRVDGLAEIEEENDRAGLLIHLASYIYAQCRLRLYRKALPYAQRGTLVATNYDAIYTVEEPTEPQGTGLGEWKWKALHNASVPKPRWLQSDEKIRTPGVSR